jgi:hypothetical protein
MIWYASNHSPSVAYAFVVTVPSLLNRCPAPIRRYTHRHRLKCGIYELGSGSMIHMPNFIKTGSAIQYLIGADAEVEVRMRS